MSVEKQNKEEENEEALSLKLSEGNGEKRNTKNGETLSLQALHMKEMEATEGLPLDTRVEEAHMELGGRKTDRQLRKMEKENRRKRHILKELIEKRGEQRDQEFEPIRIQDALSRKKYMRRKKTEYEN
jgi:hypothetical protein